MAIQPNKSTSEPSARRNHRVIGSKKKAYREADWRLS